MEHLINKNFLVTGATSGIGKALVKQLVESGANVAFCGRSEDKMQSLINSFDGNNGKYYFRCFDITNYEYVECFVSDSINKLGHIDYLINCAGVNSSRAKVNEIDLDDLEWMIKVNLLAPFTFMKAVYNQSMQHNDGGMILNVMSTVCSFSNEGIGAYTASKCGFDALTKVFRKEVRLHGVRICNIYPGGVDTPFREAERPQYLDADDVVNAIVHMISQPKNACVDELVIRPMIEKNYA